MTLSDHISLTEGPGFQRGRPDISTILLLSAPGSAEMKRGYPAAGATGNNLNVFLQHANQRRPDLFPSQDKFDYPIVNVWPSFEFLGLTDRTEATLKELRDPAILKRVEQALTGMSAALALGARPQFVMTHTSFRGLVIKGQHPSNTYVNRNFKSDAPTGAERRLERLAQYADQILANL